MAKTINYGLYIEDDDDVLFKEWREKVNGVSDSNMIKIDTILKSIADAGITKIEAVETSENGGENRVIFTMASGETFEFVIRNGSAGGVYTPRIVQLGSDVLNVTYERSTQDMPEISPQEIILPRGATGYTPIRGTDYWTEADKDEMKSYLDTLVLGGEW